MLLSAGERLGPYEILRLIGAGGMGEVYQARDTRLDRSVAIKVAHEQFTERFDREARTIATLNHPNICTLHDVGPNYLVMEFIDGQTLAGRIKQGPIAVDEAISIAKKIANALEAAHERGIVHRDLKPANIKMTADGLIKVLDFGLAKAGGVAAATPEDSPTISMATQPGVILGTAAYMSPEQARGNPVDKRADIWAFGVVLFEMLTGRPVYARETTVETLAAGARDSPPWKDLPARTPPALIRLLHRCLDKDPKTRLRDIGEARVVLERGWAEEPNRRGRLELGWIVAGVLAAALVVVSAAYFRKKPPAPALPVRLSILAPENTVLGSTAGPGPAGPTLAISPDGRRLVISAISPDKKSRLWIRPLDSLDARPLAGTEGANNPFWSPDSRQIGFWAAGKLMKIDADGGPPVALCDAYDVRGGTWNKDGVIVFAPAHASPLFRVSSSGGTCGQLTKLETTGGVAHRNPWFLPDGHHFVFMVSPTTSAPDLVTIWVGSLDSPDAKKLLESNSNAVYSQGYLLFLRDNTLFAQSFDPRRLAIDGEAIPVAADVATAPTAARGRFAASDNGLLVYQAGAPGVRQLTWFDRMGNRLSVLGEPRRFNEVDFSPDRKFAAVAITENKNTEIWLYDVARGRSGRFTFEPGVHRSPVWSPDGRTIAFSSNRNGHFDLYRKSSDGSGAEELLFADDNDKEVSSWSPDGKFLLYYVRITHSSLTSTDAVSWALPLAASEGTAASLKPFPFSTGTRSLGNFSPDGKWIAYQSGESGRSEIYLQPFRGPATPVGIKIQLSATGGFVPRWRPDGKELFWVSPSGTLMVAEVNSKTESAPTGDVRSLGQVLLTSGRFYDVSTDGQRFLFAAPIERRNEPLTVIENWTSILKK